MKFETPLPPSVRFLASVCAIITVRPHSRFAHNTVQPSEREKKRRIKKKGMNVEHARLLFFVRRRLDWRRHHSTKTHTYGFPEKKQELCEKIRLFYWIYRRLGKLGSLSENILVRSTSKLLIKCLEEKSISDTFLRQKKFWQKRANKVGLSRGGREGEDYYA